MKNINITREKAIETMSNLLNEGCSIPVVGLGNGSSDLFFIDHSPYSDSDPESFINTLYDTEDYSFRVVPEPEIAEDFTDNLSLSDFDVCVEFANTSHDNIYREQFLLWDVE